MGRALSSAEEVVTLVTATLCASLNTSDDHDDHNDHDDHDDDFDDDSDYDVGYWDTLQKLEGSDADDYHDITTLAVVMII